MQTKSHFKFIILFLALNLSLISTTFASKQEYDKKTSHQRVYELTPKTIQKYNVNKALKYIFTKKGFANIKKKYGEVKVPQFMEDLLQLKNCYHRKALKENGKFFKWSDDGKFVVMANPSYATLEQLTTAPETIKNNPDGLGIIIWAIHPDLLKNSLFHCSYTRNEDFMMERVAKLAVLKDKSDSCHRSALPTFELNLAKTKFKVFHSKEEPYLASILDLTKDHISMLEEMKRVGLEHLEKVYGVSDDDQVRFYFHFPYAAQTVTLHLHIRVNQGVHPLEAAKSFMLDDIIDTLRSGKTVEDLILEEQGKRGGGIFANKGAEETMEGINGVTIEVVDNPYIYDESKQNKDM